MKFGLIPAGKKGLSNMNVTQNTIQRPLNYDYNALAYQRAAMAPGPNQVPKNIWNLDQFR